ncbi:MFS monocarboxylate transporter like protein [Zymoseptoria brevis]|uniref:MFS monocarboxylate transporter like protein n=1 Tax=Zymoseptoria brevis TaxID=1047168 RepID=A0A0F4GLE0_9PEZI|nr:MFS monocarboxylate transporter like protein [Zymoseptoria brevis]
MVGSLSSRSSMESKGSELAASSISDPDYDLEKQQSSSTTSETTDGEPFGSALQLTTSHLSQSAHPSIPNGGLKAWLQVLTAFFLFFDSWGLINAHGTFQIHYRTVIFPDHSPTTLSWIGSLSAFLLCLTTVFTGPLIDHGHARITVSAGAFLVLSGLLATSACTMYWQLLLAQGVCMGIGQGCLFISAISVLPRWFSTRRSFALGLAAAGSSLGGVAYSLTFHQLISHFSFAITLRLLAAISLPTLLIPCILLDPDPNAAAPFAVSKSRVSVFPSLKPFLSLPFSLLALASFMGSLALYIPFIYLPAFAMTSTTFPATQIYLLVPILSLASIFGRIIPGLLADRLGALNVLAAFTLLTGLVGLCWTGVSERLGLVVWAVGYGAVSGGFVSLQPAGVVSLSPKGEEAGMGGRLGLNTFCGALGLLVGTPVAGILAAKYPSWVGVQVLCGGALVVAGGLVVAARIAQTGLAVWKKA